jgi:hypothetical protein
MSVYATAAYEPGNRRIPSVDGEGKTIDNRPIDSRHGFTLLAVADDRGFRDYIEHDGSKRLGVRHDGPRFIFNTHYHEDDTAPNYGLPTVRCLEFLLSIPRDPADLIISFSFTYDVTKILQDLPMRNLWEFGKLGLTVWDGYEISGIPRKYLDIKHGDRRVRVWDVFAYWQMSFAKALDSSRSLFTDAMQDVIANIVRMKKERAHFDEMSDDEIREYCFSECECLTILYRDLLRWCDHLGYRQSSHFGPGSMATAFFTAESLKAHMPYGTHSDYLSGLPAYVAIHTYYGGRFEITAQGLIPHLIEYDIQSAYPAIAVQLPCLAHGHFERVTEFDPKSRWGFYYVGSRTSGPWAPFPFRANSETGKQYLNHASKGAIAFVHGGRRWVTADEVRTARKYFGDDAIPVYDGWVFVPGCNEKPFKRIVEMYLWRKIGDPTCSECLAGHEVNGKRVYFCDNHKEPSDGLSKIIKLIINSIYGKLAQAIGWKLTNPAAGLDNPDAYSAPVFQCYTWAAWITGGTRARVAEAAFLGGRKADCPDCHNGAMFRACERHSTVKSIATDGILTTEEIPELLAHPYELGTWETAPKPEAWLGMPGIYNFKDYGKPDKCSDCKSLGIACDIHQSDKKFKRRGLDSRYFPAEHLRAAWERGMWSVGPIGDPDCPECQQRKQACPNPEHGIRAFMPLRQALTRIDALDVIGEWLPLKKVVKFRSVTHKRNYPDVADDDFMMPHGPTLELQSITVPDDVRSEPFTPKQTWEQVHAYDTDDFDIPMWDDKDEIPEMRELLI